MRLRGTAPAQATINVYEGGQLLGSDAASSSGDWAVEVSGLTEGTHIFEVTQDSSEAATRTVKVDTLPPPAPSLNASVNGSTVTLTGAVFDSVSAVLFDGQTALGPLELVGGEFTRVLRGVTAGVHAYRVVASDAAGNTAESPRDVTVAAPAPAATPVAEQTPAPTPTPTPTPLAAVPTPAATPSPAPTGQLPPPVVGKAVNVEVKTGRVLVKVPGSSRFVELVAGQQIPVGTIVDATKGHVTLSSTGAGGVLETAEFYDGIFKVTQTTGARPVTVVTLAETLSCPKPGGKAAAAAAKKKTRKLWGSGKGTFRTEGKYSAATVRGTTWLVQDTCTTTLTKVTQGVVEVRDNVRRKTVLVKPGKPYTARAGRR